MTVTIRKGAAKGEVRLPPSKSILHRLFIAASLCNDAESRISPFYPGEDLLATLDCLSLLGARVARDGEAMTFRGVDPAKRDKPLTLPCRQSASTLRFLLPLLLLSKEKATFCGDPSLFSRPLGVYEKLVLDLGGTYEKTENSFSVCGLLRAGCYEIDAQISSQFVTGLLFALPLAKGDSRLLLREPIVSRPYLDLTVSVLLRFGIAVHYEDAHTLFIPGGQVYRAGCFTAEGDASTAAFFEALNYLGPSTVTTDLPRDSLQADARFYRYFPQIASGSPTLDFTDCPDLVPIAAVLAAALHGALFTGTGRLLLKESDRAYALETELRKCGADITAEEDVIRIRPAPLHSPAEALDAHGDHRIAMALGILLSTLGGTVRGAEAVSKSAPDFWKILSSLGIPTEETT